jgi:ferritin-like metal-binding protein YciE
MKKIKNLYDLLIEQLRDLYDGNSYQLKFLTGLSEHPESPELQTNIDYYIRETKMQNNRLYQVFTLLNEEPESGQCAGIRAMARDAKKLLKSCENSAVCDAALITLVQHINHYEIAGYGTAISYAKALEKHEISRILLDSLRECKNADSDFSEIAQKFINPDAL